MKTKFSIYAIVAALSFVPAALNAQVSINGVKVPTNKKDVQEQIDSSKKEARDKADAEKKKVTDKIDAAKDKTEDSGTDAKDAVKDAKGKAADKGLERANDALNGTGIKITR